MYLECLPEPGVVLIPGDARGTIQNRILVLLGLTLHWGKVGLGMINKILFKN